MPRPLILSLLLLLSTVAWGADSPGRDGDEEVLKRTLVPSAEQPQGEVQIVRRGSALVVRTLLASTVLKRVVAAIDAKERRHWPESSAGFVASQRYRDELYAATQQVWERFRTRTERAELRQSLGIDFIQEGRRGRIELYAPRLSGDYGSLAVAAAESLSSWRVAGDYVRENMVIIVADSFGLDSVKAGGLLDGYRPAD